MGEAQRVPQGGGNRRLHQGEKVFSNTNLLSVVCLFVFLFLMEAQRTEVT